LPLFLNITSLSAHLQTVWILVQRNADWKPLQFLAFAFFYRVFEKLKSFEPEVAPVLNVSFKKNQVYLFFVPVKLVVEHLVLNISFVRSVILHIEKLHENLLQS